MLKVSQILVSMLGLAVLGVALTACGQRGPLYLPTEAAAKNRATLPSLLLPNSSRANTPSAPAGPVPSPGAKKVPDGATSDPAGAGAPK